jgi:hypothetical protein
MICPTKWVNQNSLTLQGQNDRILSSHINEG